LVDGFLGKDTQTVNIAYIRIKDVNEIHTAVKEKIVRCGKDFCGTGISQMGSQYQRIVVELFRVSVDQDLEHRKLFPAENGADIVQQIADGDQGVGTASASAGA